jgi:acetyl esterase
MTVDDAYPVPPGLAPESRAILAMCHELGLFDFDAGTVEGLRTLALAERPMLGTVIDACETEEKEIELPGGPVRIRVYRAIGTPARRAILWIHGGGWVIGDLDHADVDCRGLCVETDSMVVSVEYVLAPEHPFPEGLNEAYAALGWLSEQLAGSATQLVVGGDSAGGNMAAALCLMARERGGPKIDHQLLLYPVTSSSCDTNSYGEFADGYLLTRKTMEYFWDLYAGDLDARRDPFASVLGATDLSGLPAATVVIAGCDVLRDEGESYAERLRLAGVPTEVFRYPGHLHGFWTYRGASDIATEVNKRIRERFDRLENP